MSRTDSTGSLKSRPSALSSNKSFTRYEPSPPSPTSRRSRASTNQSFKRVDSLQNESPLSPSQSLGHGSVDVFEKTEEDDSEQASPSISRSQTLPENFDELPIEVASLVDRYELPCIGSMSQANTDQIR